MLRENGCDRGFLLLKLARLRSRDVSGFLTWINLKPFAFGSV
jgi:hypothetical protein